MDRRGFLKWLIGGMGVVALGGIFYPIVRFLKPPAAVSGAIGQVVNVGAVTTFPPGQLTAVSVNGKPAVVPTSTASTPCTRSSARTSAASSASRVTPSTAPATAASSRPPARSRTARRRCRCRPTTPGRRTARCSSVRRPEQGRLSRLVQGGVRVSTTVDIRARQDAVAGAAPQARARRLGRPPARSRRHDGGPVQPRRPQARDQLHLLLRRHRLRALHHPRRSPASCWPSTTSPRRTTPTRACSTSARTCSSAGGSAPSITGPPAAWSCWSFVHMLRVFFTGAYKAPRELNWLTGVLLFVITMGFGFTGYLLPVGPEGVLGHQGRHRHRRLRALHRSLPARQPARRRADQRRHAGPLLHLHVLVLPALIVVLLLGHFWMIRRHGISGRL